MDSKDWFIILNPYAGGGLSKKRKAQIKQYLVQKKVAGKVYETSKCKNAEVLTKEAIEKGFKRIICVGGDGTVHNLVNGIFNQSMVSTKEIIVGLVPVGTGNDWARHHNIPKDYQKAIDIIASGNVTQQDIGSMKVVGEKQKLVYFMNSAGVGFDGYVISTINKYKFLGGISYLVAAILNFISFKNFDLNLRLNSKKIKTSAFILVVGLCKYTGGGMKLARDPKHNDGLLDITLAENFTKLDVIKNIPKLFNGKIFKSKKVSTYKTKEISIEIISGSNFAQADGELILGKSFDFKILKEAFSVCQ
ncbi:diacylglycerol kinase family lipid kinase [Flavobacteriaceae bacterium]|nr:diacylglycerol kinase family lipid kinase [Flavobacteriaceae bacterium]MDC1492212.1 diacylglycerol kinase family lipid kinase [Flavobacteriaceae bacterium]